MDVVAKDLCRLCAQENQFLKELLDERNKSILDLIRQFTQITITECDNMPTKVCLDCEEKVVNFQLFILQCYKVQDSLRKLYLKSCDNLGIKIEHTIEYELPTVKPEVKDEFTADDLLNAVSEASLLEDDYNDNDDSDDDDDDFNDDDEEERPIATLKQMKAKRELKTRKEIIQNSDLKVKDFISFNCHLCNKDCFNWLKLKSHCGRVHKVRPEVQCTCGIHLKSKSTMYKHIQDHKNPSNLSCDQCSKILTSASALNKHKLRHVPKSERKFDCSICGRQFKNKDCMRSHEKSHIPIKDRKVYNCDFCEIKFTTRSAALSHKRIVHFKVKSYVCDLCGYACGTNGELRQHRAIHSDDKPFVCQTCSKRFKTYSNLKTHADTHEDTSYVCYVCNRVLNSRRTLRKHLLVHSDSCRHICSFCNKAFKRRQTLKVHLHMHTGDKPLSCKWCDERFSYASTLRSHRLRCHPDKMAAHAPAAYSNYSTHTARVQDDFSKNDLATVAAVNVTKNQMEAIQ